MKNHAEESDHAITLDIARGMTIKESNLTEKQEWLDNKTLIIPTILNSHQNRNSFSSSSEEYKSSKENSIITYQADFMSTPRSYIKKI